MAYTHNGTLFGLEKEGKPDIRHNLGESGGRYARWNKSDVEGQIPENHFHEESNSQTHKEESRRWVPEAEERASGEVSVEGHGASASQGECVPDPYCAALCLWVIVLGCVLTTAQRARLMLGILITHTLTKQ